MRLWHVLSKVLIGIVGFFLVGVLTIGFIDLGRFKDPISGVLSDYLDREVIIEDSLSLVFFPNPTLKVKGLSVINPPWAQGNWVKLDELALKLRFSSLFKEGPIALDYFHVKGLDIHLLVNEEGKNNWTFDESDPKASSDSLGEPPIHFKNRPILPVIADEITIENTSIRYQHVDQPNIWQRIGKIHAKQQGIGDFFIEGRVWQKDTPLDFTLLLKDYSQFVQGASLDLNLDMEFSGSEIKAVAKMTDLYSPQQLETLISVHIPDLYILSEKIDLRLPKYDLKGETQLRFQLKSDFDTFNYEFDASLGGLDLKSHGVIDEKRFSNSMTLNSLSSLVTRLNLNYFTGDRENDSLKIEILGQSDHQKVIIDEIELLHELFSIKGSGNWVKNTSTAINVHMLMARLADLDGRLPDQPLEFHSQFKLDGSLVDTIYHLSGKDLTRVQALFDFGAENMSSSTNLRLGDFSSKLDATISAQEGHLSLLTDPLNGLEALFKLESLPEQPLSLLISVKPDGDITNALELTAMKMTLGDEAEYHARVDLTARWDNVIESPLDSMMSIRAEILDISQYYSSLPNLPMNMAFDLATTGQNLNFSNLAIQVDTSDIAGSLSFNLGSPFKMTADLKSRLLDLNPWKVLLDAENESANSASEESRKASAYVFTETRLPLESLERFYGELDFKAQEIRLPKQSLFDVALEADVSENQLGLEAKLRPSNGGAIKLDLDYLLDTPRPELTADLAIENIKINLISGDISDLEKVPSTTVLMELESKGESPRQLASFANGKIAVVQGPGKIDNGLVSRFTNDVVAQLFETLNPFTKKERYSDLECNIFAFDITNGQADISALLSQGNSLMVVGGGKMDFRNETFLLEFNTKPRSGVGISADMFVTPFVSLTGTMKRPKMGLNKRGILLNGGAAMMTGGLSLVYEGFFDRATAIKDRCRSTLKAVDFEGFSHEVNADNLPSL